MLPIQEQPSIDFTFKTMGNYDATTVVINAEIPFRKLHLLYKLPLVILKAYWAVIFSNKHPTTSLKACNGYGLYLYENFEKFQADEKNDVEFIEQVTPVLTCFKEDQFPVKA